MCTKSQLNSISKAMVECYKGVYGNDIVEIVLYGSYARGDYNQNSDIDVMVLVNTPVDIIKKILILILLQSYMVRAWICKKS